MEAKGSVVKGLEEELKEYRRQYYLKTREKRRKKIQCRLCRRFVSTEYLNKHYLRRICLNNRNSENSENGVIVKTT